MELLIGLDIGTTGCRAAIFDEKGNIHAQARREYMVDIPHPNWAEQDAEEVWKLALDTLVEAINKCENKDNIDAISLSVQGEAVIPIDETGNALRPAILGMDTRTVEQNQWIVKQFDPYWLYTHTGMPVHTVNTLPKLLWIKNYEKDVWQKARRFVLYEDFIINKLTGQAACSICLASRTQLFDINKRCWSEDILRAFEIDVNKLSEVVPSASPVGPMKKELAELLGIKHAPIVVTGGHDQACGALGGGLVKAGEASVSTGTAEVIELAMDSPNLKKALWEGNISVYYHVIPNLYLAMTLNHSGGLVLRWYRDQFCQWEVQMAAQHGQDPYDYLLEGVSLDPSGLLVLPHFSGSGTPWFDTSSKGAILGLTFSITKKELAKAILEGLTYELNENIELLRNNGIEVNEIRAIGGGARSNLWLQLKADICGLPVLRPRITDAACWGAAILAGTGIGMFSSAKEAAERSVIIENCFEPDEKRRVAFSKQYELYKKVYPSVKPICEKL